LGSGWRFRRLDVGGSGSVGAGGCATDRGLVRMVYVPLVLGEIGAPAYLVPRVEVKGRIW
jgi:hypothetical protein